MLRLLVWLLLLAAMLYVMFWALDRRAQGGQGDQKPQQRPHRPTPPRPRGPDDDEDFLRELERKRREGT